MACKVITTTTTIIIIMIIIIIIIMMMIIIIIIITVIFVDLSCANINPEKEINLHLCITLTPQTLL